MSMVMILVFLFISVAKMEMTTAKTVAVFAIICGCFAVLYPKIFHPMVLRVLGVGQQKPKVDDIQNRMPQHLRPGGPAHGKSHPARDDIPSHMKGGPHPGLRAAAEMRKQAAAQQGSAGKGMMGVVLPMYAVGIIIYLIYTMTKVFGRKEKSEVSGSGDYLGNHFNDIRYNADKQKFVVGGSEEELQRRRAVNQQKDLEKLLLKADKEDISDGEMIELKRRLLETEAQMARILEAMEAVQQKVGSTVAAAASEVLAKEEEDIDSGEVLTDQDRLVSTHSGKHAENLEDEDADSVEDVGAVDYAADMEEDDDEENVGDEISGGSNSFSEGKDIRNFLNLAEELKDLTVSGGNIWRDELADAKSGENGDLRQRTVEKRRSE